jgi:hypothetical protein
MNGYVQTHNDSLFQLVNGTHLAGEFLNRTFLVDTGAITISINGTRLTSVFVQQFDDQINDLKVYFQFLSLALPSTSLINFPL